MENQLFSAIEEKLYISATDSVQPNVLLRTPLFSPVGKKSDSRVANDLTEQFKDLEFFKLEGYDSVSVSGRKLNVQTDFKVWCGIIFAFSKYGHNTDKITFKFTEFVKLCGYEPRRFNQELRDQVGQSLERIQSQSLAFKTKDNSKLMATSLVHKAFYDTGEDIVTLVADPDLWEIYRIDRQILISLKVLEKLPRAETAQCLYLFFVSLPERPIPVTLSRMRERLRLKMADKEVNRSIRNAISKLESIGYLQGEWVKFNGESAYQIHKRDKALPA